LNEFIKAYEQNEDIIHQNKHTEAAELINVQKKIFSSIYSKLGKQISVMRRGPNDLQPSSFVNESDGGYAMDLNYAIIRCFSNIRHTEATHHSTLPRSAGMTHESTTMGHRSVAISHHEHSLKKNGGNIGFDGPSGFMSEIREIYDGTHKCLSKLDKNIKSNPSFIKVFNNPEMIIRVLGENLSTINLKYEKKINKEIGICKEKPSN
jgi:hypothetical protein